MMEFLLELLIMSSNKKITSLCGKRSRTAKALPAAAEKDFMQSINLQATLPLHLSHHNIGFLSFTS